MIISLVSILFYRLLPHMSEDICIKLNVSQLPYVVLLEVFWVLEPRWVAQARFSRVKFTMNGIPFHLQCLYVWRWKYISPKDSIYIQGINLIWHQPEYVHVSVCVCMCMFDLFTGQPALKQQQFNWCSRHMVRVIALENLRWTWKRERGGRVDQS